MTGASVDPKKPRLFDWIIFCVVIIAVFLLLTGCKSKCERLADKIQRNCPTTIERTDSVKEVRIVEYRDTVIEIMGETIHDTIKVECDSLGNVVEVIKDTSGSKASVRTIIKNNTIFTRCDCKDEKRTIKKLRQSLKESKTRTVYEREIIRVDVVPSIFKILTMVAGFIILATIVGIIRKFRT